MALKINPFEKRIIKKRPLSAEQLRQVPQEEFERCKKNHERLYGALPITEANVIEEKVKLEAKESPTTLSTLPTLIEHKDPQASPAIEHKSPINRTQAPKESNTIEHNEPKNPLAIEHKSPINRTQAPKESNTIEHNEPKNPLAIEHNVTAESGKISNSKRTDEAIEHKQAVVFDSLGSCVRLKDDLCSIDQPPIEHKQAVVFDSLSSCVRLKDDLCAIGSGVNRTQNRNQSNTRIEHNRTQKDLSVSPQQLAILHFILADQSRSGLGHSQRLRRDQIAHGVGISAIGVRTQLARLVEKGYLQRLDSRAGRGEPGSVYHVPASIVQALNRTQQSNTIEHKSIKNRTQQSNTTIEHKLHVVSSSLDQTTTDSEVARKLTFAVQQFDLGSFGIGANDLLDLWRQRTADDLPLFPDLQGLLASVEHIAFYLRSPDASSIKSPKAWVMATLRKGFYARPAGFKSWAEQQEQLRLEALEQELEEINRLRIKRFAKEFEVWMLKLTIQEREEILRSKKWGGAVIPPPPHSPAARSMLREYFARENGFEDILNVVPHEDT